MSLAYTRHFSTRETPQSEPIPDKPMVANSAGGYSFAVDDWARLNRFLILGAEGGTYYIGEKKLTVENALSVLRCLDADPVRAIKTIVDVSESGRAPKNDPAIFALAIAAGHKNPSARALAMYQVSKVCRIGTHIFQFAEAVQAFRGWGKGLRKGIASWYEDKTPEKLAYQVAKYAQRNGWSHADLCRLSHPVAESPASQSVLRWVVAGADGLKERSVKRGEITMEYGAVSWFLPPFLAAVDEAKTADENRLVALIAEHDLPRECVPTEKLNSIKVWEALMLKMPLTAMVRNLGKMTSIGLLKPLGAQSQAVAERLCNQEYILKSRLHPLAILLAAKTYASGHGDKGSLTWHPVSQVNDALDAAFYLSFGNVVPAGKRTLVGLDVSMSMSARISGTSISCAEAAAALAMVQLKTEPRYQLMAFDQRMRELDISKYSRLTDVIRNTSNINGGGTDCSLPMIFAGERKWDVDTFIVLTDAETWAGEIHPSQALVRYRQQTGIDARLIVVGMVSDGFTIADPSDNGMLDVVGFDTAAPAVMNDFSGGRI